MILVLREVHFHRQDNECAGKNEICIMEWFIKQDAPTPMSHRYNKCMQAIATPPIHYMKQGWLIINYFIRNTCYWNFNPNIIVLQQKCIWKCHKWKVIHFVKASMFPECCGLMPLCAVFMCKYKIGFVQHIPFRHLCSAKSGYCVQLFMTGASNIIHFITRLRYF